MVDQASNNGGGKIPSNVLTSATALFAVATQPRDKLAVDAARRRLWGTSITSSRSGSFDPFDNLYKLGNFLLKSLYMDLQQYDVDDVVTPLISEVSMFLGRCNPQTVSKTLSNLQDGIAPWLRDEKSQLSSRHKSAGAEAASRLLMFCSKIMLTCCRRNFSGMGSAPFSGPWMARRTFNWT